MRWWRTAKSTMSHDYGAYDVLVWIDDDGDVVCQSYSPEGRTFLRSMFPGYESHQVLEILCTPEEFTKHIPPDVLVGRVMYPTKKIVPLGRPMVH